MNEILEALKTEKKAPKKSAAFTIEADTLNKLKRIAEENGLSVSAVANAILTNALKEE